MAEPTLRCCRCGEPMPRPTPLGNGLRGVTVCPCCHISVVSEQGENAAPRRQGRRLVGRARISMKRAGDAQTPRPTAQEVSTPMQTTDYCRCGCGERPNPGRQYINGHNRRGLYWHADPIVYFERRIRREDRGYASECWLWQGPVKANGYAQFHYRTGPDQQGGQQAHRWRWEQDNGPVPEGHHLDHLCKVRRCVNPAHLEPVTPLENARRSKSCKLTDEQARAIFRRKENGEATKDLAAEFDVSRSTVNNIAKNGPDGPRTPEQNARHRATVFPSKRNRRYQEAA
jgi:hypothetical protein